MKPVAWGILSVSSHYLLRVHEPLSRLPEARIAAIASRDPIKGREAAARLGIGKAYGSYEELLADPEIEAVYIPLPNDLHEPWCRKALAAGKHVLCEKPLGMNPEEARAIMATAREKGLLAMEAFMYRFHPQWSLARDIVARGEIGRPREIRVVFSYNNADPRNIRNIKAAGGGALYDIGCYAVSAARYLADAEPERAFSLVRRDEATGTDVLSSGILDFGASGTRASFTVSTRSFSRQRVEVLGDKGALEIELPFNAYPDVPLGVTVSTGIGVRRVTVGPVDQYGLMFAAFSRAMREGTVPPEPLEDALANARALDALFRSEASGLWEKV